MLEQTAIKLKGIHKSFSNGWLKKSLVIKNLDLEIKNNEIFGYLGANGAGKTTTFKLMLGLIKPDKGEISFWGNPVSDLKTRALVGYLPEHPYFYSYLTAKEALEFYASLFDMDRALKKKRVGDLLDLVGLDHARGVQLRKFSRGMLQRIGIAQAMVNDPKLLILDEPMSGLDPMGRKDMRDIILNCRDQGKTIIFSSHIIADVEMICDRAGILAKGELQQIVAMDDPVTAGETSWEITCRGGQLNLSGLDRETDIKQVVRGSRNIISTRDQDLAGRIMEQVKEQGLDLISFASGRKSIEDIYIKSIDDGEDDHE
ncbi:ABC transporter ATP-binding protein [Desulfospira joergensenii]|uniref:ABC transporter ATP-binding protein n=1 Tax=Desulfospira joergensenii TaxID=53329 RepID=UPI0006848F4D|nr:ABC transporter ATP-binding protein [Desulfospira joergensenii]